MDELNNFIQSGGSETFNMVNQTGGAIQGVLSAVNVIFPILFFIISKIAHDNLDEDRAEADTSLDEDDSSWGRKEYVIWGLYSIKVNLFMMALCFVLGWFPVAWLWFKIPEKVMPMQTMFQMFWKVCFGLMILTHAYSIVFGGLRSTAYQYLNDELYDNRAKMETTCVDFGCGWAPHGSQKVVRGTDYRE